MGDADQHPEVGVQLVLKRGAWQAWPPPGIWLQATLGWAGASWRCARACHRARPPLGCRAELLEPAVGAGSTDAVACTTGGFAASNILLASAPSSAFLPLGE